MQRGMKLLMEHNLHITIKIASNWSWRSCTTNYRLTNSMKHIRPWEAKATQLL